MRYIWTSHRLLSLSINLKILKYTRIFPDIILKASKSSAAIKSSSRFRFTILCVAFLCSLVEWFNSFLNVRIGFLGKELLWGLSGDHSILHEFHNKIIFEGTLFKYFIIVLEIILNDVARRSFLWLFYYQRKFTDRFQFNELFYGVFQNAIPHLPDTNLIGDTQKDSNIFPFRNLSTLFVSLLWLQQMLFNVFMF